MENYGFDLNGVDPSWRECILEGLEKIKPEYLTHLSKNSEWLPGPKNIFRAFSVPIDKINYLLIGESPYPRKESANGYAFWDQAVTHLWTPTGLSKPVNKATSFRNIMKMLLVADGKLSPTALTQENIAAINKQAYVQTNEAFFTNLLNHGFLLLNASLVLQATSPIHDAKAWYPFMHHVLQYLCKQRPNIALILLGRIAHTIDQLIPNPSIKRLYAEHPYNHTFILNSQVIDFFKPLHLLHQ
jgi:uracil-DNA glycosylase